MLYTVAEVAVNMLKMNQAKLGNVFAGNEPEEKSDVGCVGMYGVFGETAFGDEVMEKKFKRGKEEIGDRGLGGGGFGRHGRREKQTPPG